MKKPQLTPSDWVFIIITIILGVLTFTSCSKPEEIKPVYFTLETDVRDRQTRDEITKETYWIRDTCRVVWMEASGAYFLNGAKIITQVCTEPARHYNLCHARRGDVVGIDVNHDGEIEQSGTFE